MPKNRSRRPLPTRREFLGTLAGAMAFAPEVLAMQKPGPSGIPRRPLGRSGDSVSIVGFGGWDAGVHEREKDAIALIHEAIDGGITFFDNAWEYHDGRSKESGTRCRCRSTSWTRTSAASRGPSSPCAGRRASASSA